MGFTLEERSFVVARLKQKGWKFDNTSITAPSGGIWFGDSHFNDWSTDEMFNIIKKRGERVRREKHEGWEQFSNEHFQLCEAIESLPKG